MKNKFIIGSIIFLLFTKGFLFSNQNGTNFQYEEEAKALGYVLGIEYILDTISKRHPDLKPEIKNAKKEFNLSFGKSINNLENKMIKIYGPDFFNESKKIVKDDINIILNNIIINKKAAKQYIKDVRLRAEGKFKRNDIKQILLEYENLDSYSVVEALEEAKKNDSQSIFKNAIMYILALIIGSALGLFGYSMTKEKKKKIKKILKITGKTKIERKCPNCYKTIIITPYGENKNVIVTDDDLEKNIVRCRVCRKKIDLKSWVVKEREEDRHNEIK